MSDPTKDTVQRQFARQLVSKLFARAGMPNRYAFSPSELMDTLEVALGHFVAMLDAMRRADMAINLGSSRAMHSADCAKVIGFDSSKECDCCVPPPEPSVNDQHAARYMYLSHCAGTNELQELVNLNPREWDEYLDRRLAEYKEGG